jgi:hypothetical protein
MPRISKRPKGRIIVNPCLISVSDSYRPFNVRKHFLFEGAASKCKLSISGKLCYHWELIVNPKPDLDQVYGEYSIVGHFNYESELECLDNARSVAKFYDIRVIQEITVPGSNVESERGEESKDSDDESLDPKLGKDWFTVNYKRESTHNVPGDQSEDENNEMP